MSAKHSATLIVGLSTSVCAVMWLLADPTIPSTWSYLLHGIARSFVGAGDLEWTFNIVLQSRLMRRHVAIASGFISVTLLPFVFSLCRYIYARLRERYDLAPKQYTRSLCFSLVPALLLGIVILAAGHLSSLGLRWHVRPFVQLIEHLGPDFVQRWPESGTEVYGLGTVFQADNNRNVLHVVPANRSSLVPYVGDQVKRSASRDGLLFYLDVSNFDGFSHGLLFVSDETNDSAKVFGPALASPRERHIRMSRHVYLVLAE